MVKLSGLGSLGFFMHCAKEPDHAKPEASHGECSPHPSKRSAVKCLRRAKARQLGTLLRHLPRYYGVVRLLSRPFVSPLVDPWGARTSRPMPEAFLRGVGEDGELS